MKQKLFIGVLAIVVLALAGYGLFSLAPVKQKLADALRFWGTPRSDQNEGESQAQGAFRKFGLDPNKILTVNTAEFNYYQEGPPLQ